MRNSASSHLQHFTSDEQRKVQHYVLSGSNLAAKYHIPASTASQLIIHFLT
jgi:hypothetical protein